jgi:hypothetical protein
MAATFHGDDEVPKRLDPFVALNADIVLLILEELTFRERW